MNPALDETTDAGYQRPRDPVEIWLARRWQDVLGFTVGIRENFFGVGGNSLDAARVINAVLVEFGVQLPLNVLTEHPTVERLATQLRHLDSVTLPGPLVAIQDGDGTHPPLFLVHADDGQVAPYCRLAYALGEDFAVSGLQAAGLYSDEAPGGTVAAMADAYVDAIRAVHPTGPYLLGGAGIGAAIAYEMAVRLDDVRLVAALGAELVALPDTELPESADLPGILANWQERDLVPQGVAPEFVARSLRVWQANRDAARDWQPSPDGTPIDVFGGPIALPATVVQRTHECGTDGSLADALRELIG